jgi:hypothetical protein
VHQPAHRPTPAKPLDSAAPLLHPAGHPAASQPLAATDRAPLATRVPCHAALAAGRRSEAFLAPGDAPLAPPRLPGRGGSVSRWMLWMLPCFPFAFLFCCKHQGPQAVYEVLVPPHQLAAAAARCVHAKTLLCWRWHGMWLPQGRGHRRPAASAATCAPGGRHGRHLHTATGRRRHTHHLGPQRPLLGPFPCWRPVRMSQTGI